MSGATTFSWSGTQYDVGVLAVIPNCVAVNSRRWEQFCFKKSAFHPLSNEDSEYNQLCCLTTWSSRTFQFCNAKSYP